MEFTDEESEDDDSEDEDEDLDPDNQEAPVAMPVRPAKKSGPKELAEFHAKQVQ